MRVYIGQYKNWWGPYQIADLMQHVGVSEDTCYKLGEFLANTWLSLVCGWIHSKRHRKVYVRIDNYDTWGMDSTLSLIILPMLKQLKATKCGSSFVDDEDVPKNLHMTKKEMIIFNYGKNEKYTKEEVEAADVKFFARWEYILDEMIWSFEQIVDRALFVDGVERDITSDDQEQINRERIKRGTTFFGKYYMSLWD